MRLLNKIKFIRKRKENERPTIEEALRADSEMVEQPIQRPYPEVKQDILKLPATTGYNDLAVQRFEHFLTCYDQLVNQATLVCSSFRTDRRDYEEHVLTGKVHPLLLTSSEVKDLEITLVAKRQFRNNYSGSWTCPDFNPYEARMAIFLKMPDQDKSGADFQLAGHKIDLKVHSTYSDPRLEELTHHIHSVLVLR